MESSSAPANDVTTSNAVNNESSLWNVENVRIERLVSIVFTSTSSLVTLYIVMALVVYGVKRRTWACSYGLGAGTSSTKRDASIMHTLTLVTAVSVLVYLAVEFPLYWGVEEPYCATYHRVKIACTACGLFTVYFTLWYRVYTVFYSNPMLRKSTSAVARVLNKLTVALLVVMTAVNVAAFLTSPMYKTAPIGCVKVQTKKDAKLKWGLLVTTTLLFQGLLLFSLLYPLCLHQRKLKERGMKGRSIMPLVKRAAITAGICMASDTLNAVYALTNKQTVVYLRYVVYGTNFMINLIALLLSFTDWKEKIFPCCCQQENANRRQSVATLRTKSARSSIV